MVRCASEQFWVHGCKISAQLARAMFLLNTISTFSRRVGPGADVLLGKLRRHTDSGYVDSALRRKTYCRHCHNEKITIAVRSHVPRARKVAVVCITRFSVVVFVYTTNKIMCVVIVCNAECILLS
jgi:hypothetical protein